MRERALSMDIFIKWHIWKCAAAPPAGAWADAPRVIRALVVLLAINSVAANHADAQESCRVTRNEKKVELCSPFFVLSLDTTNGLRAKAWENRLSGRTISLGDGPELKVDIGLPGQPLRIPVFAVSAMKVNREGKTAEVVFTLESKQPAISALVTYRWDAKRPVLQKFVEITNKGSHEIGRLLDVRLGTYVTDAKITERERGFPAYLGDDYFISLAHPSGWAMGKDGNVELRQHPGAKLAPGEKLQCMEAVYGVAEAGQARKGFVAHVRSRMRRVARGHDKPYAIFDNFGSWTSPSGTYQAEGAYQLKNSEAYMLHSLDRLAQSRKAAGCRFDLCNIHFWVDCAGDMKQFAPQRFPNGMTKIKESLDRLEIAPGLWIDSGGQPPWTIGDNPTIRGCFTKGEGRGELCRATEPINSMYKEAFIYHVRENGVKLLKFDNLGPHTRFPCCNNPAHGHLPGPLYSIEAIHNAVIDFLQELDEACPDVFVMLYWGYRSPWWLLHGDTLFDSGIGIEAASPASQPAPHARDSVTQKLDQAQRHSSDVPVLGKDSLGIWLSDWSWNSQIGKERWQEGFIMDMCRGSLLAQMWSDRDWLSPPEWKQLADFIALLRARPECFGNPRFILGDPRKDEPYGYCCSDGRRAMLALNNCTWEDRLLPLELNSTWGLPDGMMWDLYRWYPDPAKMGGPQAAFGEKAAIVLRPFEVVLLEAVPHGQLPSLNRNLQTKPIPVAFAEASRPVKIESAATRPDLLKGRVPASRSGGTLVVSVELKQNSAAMYISGPGKSLSAKAKLAGRDIACRPVFGTHTYPSCWQSWRIAVEPSTEPRFFEMSIDSSLPADAKLKISGHFLPKDE